MKGKYGEKWFTAPLLQCRDGIGPTVTAVFYFFFFPYICWARWTEAGSSRVTCTARKTAVPPAVLSQYSSCATHVVGYKGQLGASNKSEDCHKIRLFISMQCVFFSKLCWIYIMCEGWGFRFTLKQISVYACHLHNHTGDSLGGMLYFGLWSDVHFHNHKHFVATTHWLHVLTSFSRPFQSFENIG